MEVIAKKSSLNVKFYFVIAAIWLANVILQTVTVVLDARSGVLLTRNYLQIIVSVLSVVCFVLYLVMGIFCLRLPETLVYREGDTVFLLRRSFKINELLAVRCNGENKEKKPKNGYLIVSTERGKVTVRCVGNTWEARERLLVLIEESKKENPDYEKEEVHG